MSPRSRERRRGRAGGSDPELERGARAMHEVASRAVRRLDVVEWVGLGAASVVAVVGGGVVALLLAGPLGIPGRTLWVLASVLLLALPGGVALAGARRAEGRTRSREGTDRG